MESKSKKKDSWDCLQCTFKIVYSKENGFVAHDVCPICRTPRPTIWRCTYCTLTNTNVKKCLTCAHPNPDIDIRKVLRNISGSWNCPFCQVENEATFDSCHFCDQGSSDAIFIDTDEKFAKYLATINTPPTNIKTISEPLSIKILPNIWQRSELPPQKEKAVTIVNDPDDHKSEIKYASEGKEIKELKDPDTELLEKLFHQFFFYSGWIEFHKDNKILPLAGFNVEITKVTKYFEKWCEHMKYKVSCSDIIKLNRLNRLNNTFQGTRISPGIEQILSL